MAAMHELTVEYLKTRKQFGVPIGTFQVLQHRAVDMFDRARAGAQHGLFRDHDGRGAQCQRAQEGDRGGQGADRPLGKLVGQQAIQLHGGIGMTMEYKVGHYFKRATMIDTLFGDADHHLAELARLGGLVCRSLKEAPMLSPTPRAEELKKRVAAFMEEHVMPAEPIYHEQLEKAADRWTVPSVMEELKKKAKAQGLWNLFVPKHHDPNALSNLEYAPLCEIMGRSPIGAEPFNCSAPDTGNMEVLIRYGTEAQKKQWLVPLMEGKIRSCFAMTEPAVASSDATNIRAQIKRDGDHYVINGRKWWTSGATDKRCKIAIFMGQTNPDAPAVSAPKHDHRADGCAGREGAALALGVRL